MMTDETPQRRSIPGLALRGAAAVALAAATAGPTLAQDGAAGDDGPAEFVFEADGWAGGAVGGQNGAFSHCVAERDMADGFTVLFQAGPNFQVNIVLVSAGFDLEAGTENEATVVVDGAFSETYPALAAQPSALIVATGRDPELVERIMRGANATVSGPHGEVTIPLNGTFAAFGALERCVQKARELIAAGEIPAPEAAGAGGEAPSGPMTARGLDALLREAGIEDAAIADPGSIPDDPLDLRHVWQIDESLVGGLHQRPRTDVESMAAFVSGFLGLLEERCPGEATVARGEIDDVRDRYAFSDATVTCRAESGSAHVALFFALDDNYYSVFFHETSAEQAPRADEATAQVAAFVRGLAEGIRSGSGAQPAGPAGGLSITGAGAAASGARDGAAETESDAGSDAEEAPAQ